MQKPYLSQNNDAIALISCMHLLAPIVVCSHHLSCLWFCRLFLMCFSGSVTAQPTDLSYMLQQHSVSYIKHFYLPSRLFLLGISQCDPLYALVKLNMSTRFALLWVFTKFALTTFLKTSITISISYYVAGYTKYDKSRLAQVKDRILGSCHGSDEVFEWNGEFRRQWWVF